MRKTVAVLLLSLLPLTVHAAKQENDAEEMGSLAGVVLACQAYKPLYQFEEILSRYYSNTSSSEAVEKAKLKQYALAKAGSFSLFTKRKIDCAEVVNDFVKMPVFKSELYSDGSLRLPDGKFLYPRGQKKLAKNAEKIYPVSK